MLLPPSKAHHAVDAFNVVRQGQLMLLLLSKV
jgi:hypothetical protein